MRASPAPSLSGLSISKLETNGVLTIMVRHLGLNSVNLKSDFFMKLARVKNPKQIHQDSSGNVPVVLALDPGHTTGVAVLEGGILRYYGQIDTATLTMQSLQRIEYVFEKARALGGPGQIFFDVVIEDYRIYSWKSEEHEWSEVYVARLIGFIMSVCVRLGIKPTFRLAQNAKGFVTDDKLKTMNWYFPGWQHSRDAIRHAVYHVLFDNTYVERCSKLTHNTIPQQ